MELSGKIVSIFGMGRSGMSALRLLSQKGAKVYAVNKGKPSSWANFDEIKSLIGEEYCIDQESAASVFAGSDLIVLSPGIPLWHEALKDSREVPIISEIELAYRFTTAPIIAVTGSNGKTTTVSLIGEMLEHSGKKVFVGGNIGIPFCDAILSGEKYDVIVLEISSFQLETIHQFHPNIAMIINIFLNHGERYDSIEDYANAKFNMSNNMDEDDLIIYPPSFELIDAWAKKQKCQTEAVDINDVEAIKKQIEQDYSLEKFKLLGPHNIINLNFAIVAALRGGATAKGIQKTIDSFRAVTHRLEYIESKDAFVPINDAKSTNWNATMTAVGSIEKKDKKLYLILGGQRRGRNDSILPYLDVIKKNVDKILLVGEMAQELSHELEGRIDFEVTETLENTVEMVRQQNFDGILLLSPAFPSYDQFANFMKRGECFTGLVTGPE